MTIKRMLLGALATVALAETSYGQGQVQPWPENESSQSHSAPLSWYSKGIRPTAGAEPVPNALPTPPATATEVLTAPPGAAMQHPPGTVTSPWCGGQALGDGCCGPTGRNGPLTYELYTYTGPSIPFGSELAKRLNTGWSLGAGTRVLFFNPPGDAAFAVDLGMSYTYNRGGVGDFFPVNTPALVQVRDIRTGQPAFDGNGNPVRERGADVPISHRIRGLHRTNFNFGIGRDYFFNGPGFLGVENGRNVRCGVDLGGRWGTAHVDMVPQVNDQLYTRRAGVTHSIYAAAHTDWERPMGAWVLLLGMRIEYDHTWTNLVPPQGGDVQSVNILMTAGLRF